MMITATILGGISDTLAQTVTAIRRRAIKDPLSNDNGYPPSKSKQVSIELDEKLPHYGHELLPAHATHSATLPPPFDFQRLARFMAYGFIIAPVQFKWLQFLQRSFPFDAAAAAAAGTSSAAALTPVLKRVALDQLVFSPIGLVAFFSYMTLAEGGSLADVKARLSTIYIPTMKANYMVWPAVQLLNFRVMPLQFQLPFGSTVGIAWGTYLSLTNSSTEP